MHCGKQCGWIMQHSISPKKSYCKKKCGLTLVRPVGHEQEEKTTNNTNRTRMNKRFTIRCPLSTLQQLFVLFVGIRAIRGKYVKNQN
jgi:hypothetical protein